MKQIYIFTLLFSQIIFGQLSSGDIAFIGYNTDSGPGVSTDHSFSFITLTNIPSNEIIYFTEEGWNDDSNIWAGTSEGHLKWTAPSGGISCGSIVYITESGVDTFTIIGGGSITLESGSGWSLSGGDQVLAYQASTAEPAVTPTFIAGINGDDGNGTPVSFDPVTRWNDPSTGPLGTAKSGLPSGLTNGVNCVSLFITTFTEEDNAKYTGTLTGTTSFLRTQINDRTKWSTHNSTAFNITPSSYSPNVDCSTLSTNNFILKTIKVFPNPSSDFIVVSNLEKIEKYSILNTLGQVVIEGNVKNNEKIYISNFTNGLYFLQFENRSPIKLIKE